MFKKSLKVLSTVLVGSSLLLAACGGGDTSSSPDKTGSAPAAKKIVIKFGHGAAEANPRHKAALKFKELVEQKSNGQMEVQVYPAEQLGSEAAMVQSLQSNLLQVTAAGAGIYAKYHEPIGATELPFMFDNFQQAWAVMDGPIGKEISEPFLKKDIRILSYWENGFRQVTNNVRPINTPADLKGIKIRTPEIPLSLSLFKAFGANPTPMSFGELFQALEQKIVDGQENPLTNIYNSKFYEVQKYVSLTGHQWMPLPLSISEKFWKTLNEEQQKIIQESAAEAGKMHRSLIEEDDKKLVAELEKHGMKVNTPDKAPFRELVAPVYKEFEAKFGVELIEKIRKAAQEVK